MIFIWKKKKKESISPQQVLYLLASPGWSQNKIVKTFAISKHTVSDIVHGKYEQKNKGRPPKIKEQHKLFITETIILCPRYSLAKVASKTMQKFPHLSISSATVSSILKEYKFKTINARVIQALNPVQKIIRYNFATNLLDMYTEDSAIWKFIFFYGFFY